MVNINLTPYEIESISIHKDSEITVGLEMMNAPKFWEKSKGENTIVAVLDTGIDVFHSDLKDVYIGGRNFTMENAPSDYTDGNGHGTHVSGTIAGRNNGKGVVGVAPETKILAVKVLDSKGRGDSTSVIGGLNYAIDWQGSNGEKVDVISMSLGTSVNVPEIHRLIKKAKENGIVVVCASGNDGDGNANTDEFMYPASYPEVVSVGAIDENKKLAYFSNTSNEIDTVGHGVGVNSTMLGERYAKLNGTSMATPHVSGAFALLIGALKKSGVDKIDVNELTELFYSKCVDLGLHDNSEGYGLVDLIKVKEDENKKEDPIRTYSIYLREYKDGYTVQLGYYTQKENAERLAERLSEDLAKSGVNVNKINF